MQRQMSATLQGVQHFQNILCCPLARGSIGKRDFVFDKFPAFRSVEGGILEIAVDHIGEFCLVARDPCRLCLTEAFMRGPVTNFLQ